MKTYSDGPCRVLAAKDRLQGLNYPAVIYTIESGKFSSKPKWKKVGSNITVDLFYFYEMGRPAEPIGPPELVNLDTGAITGIQRTEKPKKSVLRDGYPL